MFHYPFYQSLKSMDSSHQGVYRKEPKHSALENFLIYVLAGLSQIVLLGKKFNLIDKKIDRFTVHAVLSTSTHVNFDPDRSFRLIKEALLLRDTLRNEIKTRGGKNACPFGPVDFMASLGLDEMIKQGEMLGMDLYPSDNPDILLLKQTVLYGIKGVCAYTDHSLSLGQEDEAVTAFIHEGLAVLQEKDMEIDDWLRLLIRCGEIGLTAAQLLNAGKTLTYGHPVPTSVPFGCKKGKAILVSGSDFKSFELLLKQTQEKQITVYTHGQMLAANAYPRLRKFNHFFGQFGADREKQIQEFLDFPGAVLMTAHCVQIPDRTSLDNIFTCGAIGCPGTRHVRNFDFSPVIEKALTLPGFPEDKIQGEVMVGLYETEAFNAADIFPQATMPAFFSPNILSALVKLISTKPIRLSGEDRISPEREKVNG